MLVLDNLMCTSIHLEAYYVTVLENFVDPIRTPEGQKVPPHFNALYNTSHVYYKTQ